MSSISVDELQKKPMNQWLESNGENELVVTSQGRPVAVILPINAGSLESTLSALRSVRALMAQAELQEAAKKNGTDKLTMADIDAEIAAVRQNRRRK